MTSVKIVPIEGLLAICASAEGTTISALTRRRRQNLDAIEQRVAAVLRARGLSLERVGHLLSSDISAVRRALTVHARALRSDRAYARRFKRLDRLTSKIEIAPRPKPSVERHAAIIAAVQAGRPPAEVAAEHGIGRKRAVQICAAAGSGLRAIARARRVPRDAAIVAAIRQGRTQASVAAEFGIDAMQVQRIAAAAGVSRLRLAAARCGRAARNATILEAVRAGRPVAEVAAEHGLSRVTVWNICGSEASESVSAIARRRMAANEAEAIAAVRAGSTITDAALAHGIPRQRLGLACVASGVLSPGKAKLAVRAARDTEIVEAIEAGRTAHEVAVEYGITAQAVRFVVAMSRAPAIPPRRRRTTGRRKSEVHTARAARRAAAVDAVRSGKRIVDAAAEHGLSTRYVWELANAAGVRPAPDPAVAARASRDAMIVEAVRAGGTLRAVGAAHGLTGTRVRRICDRAGLAPPHLAGRDAGARRAVGTRRRAGRPARMGARDRAIVRAIWAGRAAADVAAEHGLTRGRVHQVCRAAGLSVREMRQAAKSARQRAVAARKAARAVLREERQTVIIDAYLAGGSTVTVARQLDVGTTFVFKVLRDAGVIRRHGVEAMTEATRERMREAALRRRTAVNGRLAD